MRDSDYAYAVARIRANELKLLTKQDMELLLLSENCEQCLARLVDKGWGTQGESEAEILRGELDKAWALVDDCAPEKDAFSSLKLSNDYHNLKAAFKARVAQTDWEQYAMYPTTVSISDIKAAVDGKAFNILPEHMTQAAEAAYEALVASGDGQRCDMILDAASLCAAIEEAKPYGGLLLEIAEQNAYKADVRIAVRCARMKKPLGVIRQALAECSALDADKLAEAAAHGIDAICEYLAQTDGEAAEVLGKSLKDFENLCAQRMAKRLENVRYETLGQAPIISYIHTRSEEVRQARIILAGLRNNLPQERIRELL